jgi:hypothetical protein
LIAIDAREAVYAFFALVAGELRLALFAILADKVAIAQAIKVVVAVVDVTSAAVVARSIEARIELLALIAVELGSAVAFVERGRLEQACAVVEARIYGARVERFASSAAVADWALATVVRLFVVPETRTAVEASTTVVKAAGRRQRCRRGHLGRHEFVGWRRRQSELEWRRLR